MPQSNAVIAIGAFYRDAGQALDLGKLSGQRVVVIGAARKRLHADDELAAAVRALAAAERRIGQAPDFAGMTERPRYSYALHRSMGVRALAAGVTSASVAAGREK